MAKLYFGAVTRIALWIVAAVAMIGLNIWVVVGNYIACVQSFQLLGFENKALADDELLGPLFATIAPDATIAHLLAGLFEAAVALSLWWLAHYLLTIVRLFEDRSVYASAGDDTSRRIIDHKLIFAAVRLAILAIPAIVAASTIVDLFRYRMIAQALGIENPHQATMKIASFPLELQQHGNLFAWQIANYGAWGLLCATLLIAICFELCCHKVAEASARLAALNQSEEPEQPATIVESNQESNQEPSREDDQARPSVQPPWEPAQEGNDGGPAPDAPHSTPEEPREVIGGRGSIRVTIAEAKAAPLLYWVDPETGDIWDRVHHDEVVNGRPFDPFEKAA